MNRLAIAVERAGSRRVITPSGDLAIGSSEALLKSVSDAVTEGANQVALDLSKVALLSSVGLTTIIKINGLLRQRNIEFVLVCPEGHIRDIFITTGIDQKIRFVKSREEF